MIGQDSLKTRRTLTVDGKTYNYFSLPEAAKSIGDISRLPYSLKVLLENVLRFEDGRTGTVSADLKIAEAKFYSAAAARPAAHWKRSQVTPRRPSNRRPASVSTGPVTPNGTV